MTWETSGHAQARFRQLIHDLGVEHQLAHGWKRRAAVQLRMNPAHLSRVINQNVPVGAELLHRAARELGFDADYYRGTTGTYRDWLIGSKGSGAVPWGARAHDRAALLNLTRRVRQAGASDERAADALALAQSLLGLTAVDAAQRYVASIDRGADPHSRELEAIALVMAVTLEELLLEEEADEGA